MLLTEHFTLEEMTVTQTRHLDNTPTAQARINLQRLCAGILEPLRQAIGKPIRVTSGYRSLPVNQAVGGAASSEHTLGLAADIQVDGYESFEVCQIIKRLNLPYNQLINEFGRWTHVSVYAGDALEPAPRQELTAVSIDGKTVYLNGLLVA